MGATNHTTNYNLPQFVGSDKPTWLGDVNGAMSAIDTQMKANATASATADTKAETALTNASTAQTTASGAQSTADTASTTATSALNKALSVEQALNTFESVFNLNDITQYNGSDFISTDATVASYSYLHLAKNSDNSLFKLYGSVYVTTTSSGSKTVTIQNTGLNPIEEYNILNAGIEYYGQSSSEVIGNMITVKTNGDIVIHFDVRGAVSNMRILLLPFLFFNKSFGDTPQPNP